MSINSQFFITHYTGKESLDLMAMPESFETDPVKVADYNRFIENIDTIYASQNIDGEVPKFWTRRTQVVNELGNISYKYEPHPESTLTSLSSMSSYYFILRDSSSVPVKIPVKGGEAYGFNDISSLPVIESIATCKGSIDSACPTTISLTLDNNADTKFKLNNLRPLDTYIYEVESIAASWPIMVNPISGILKPATTNLVIDVNMMFCPSTGLCGSSGNTLDYSLINNCNLTDTYRQYGTFRLKVKPELKPELEVLSDNYTIVCNDCLPGKPKVSLSPSDGSVVLSDNYTNLSADNFDGSPYYEFSVNVQEKEEKVANDKNYTYSIQTITSEWPVVFVTPTGGVVTVKTGTNSTTLKGKMFFCPTTGLCPPGTQGVPPYSVPSYPSFLLSDNSYRVAIRAVVESYDCPGQKVYSNTSTISFLR